MTAQTMQDGVARERASMAQAFAQSQSVALLELPLGEWFFAHPAYQSPLIAAVLRLAGAAWKQIPPGSLPSDEALLVAWSGLPAIEFAGHRDLLLAGWERHDGRVWFPALVERADRLLAEHGEAIERMRTNITALSLAPERFELAGTKLERSEAKARKRPRPQNFGITQQLARWGQRYFGETLRSQGARREPAQHQVLEVLNVILQEFILYTDAHATKYVDWEAGFINWVRRNTNGSFGTTANYFPTLFDQATVTPMVAMQRPMTMGSRRAQAQSSNDAALASALAMVGEQAEPDPMTWDMDEPIRPAA